MDEVMKRLGVMFIILFVGYLAMFSAAESLDELKSVIVVKDTGLKDSSFGSLSEVIPPERVDFRYSSFEGFSAQITNSELLTLEQMGYKVFIDKVYHALLDVSVPQINADDVWPLQVGGINLTGAGQTICVIDSGVNYTDPRLGGCYGENNASSSCKVLGGWDYVNGDNDSMDDYGHGTHVTGILISNDTTYRGVSQGARIIAIKSLNAAGSGSAVNILAGIDWCVNNASTFNISVISMSLGDCTNYSSYCDGSSPFTAAINAAIAKNISVVAASGNGNVSSCTGINVTFGLSDPACVQNVTAVGGVNNSDGVHASFQRWSLFQLMAPGVSICSIRLPSDSSGSVCSTGILSKSGTSMATPHVSGAIAILKQLFRLQGDGNLTSQNAKVILNNTGTTIYDSGSGRNYSRVDVLAAVLNQDRTVPAVNLTSPVDTHVNISQTMSFSCNASDWQLANLTLQVWNASGLYYNVSTNISGTSNSTTFSKTDMPYTTYTWNCRAFDALGNVASFSSNYTLTIGGASSSVVSPSNNTYTKMNQTVNCSAQVSGNRVLANMTLKVWNASGLYYNVSTNISGTSNSTTYVVNFSAQGDYTLGCISLTNDSFSGESTNVTIHYDTVIPTISSVDVDSITSDGAIVTWTTNEAANSSVMGDILKNSSSFVTGHSVTLSGLSASTEYDYYVRSCDRAGNCASSSTDSFTTGAGDSGGGNSGSGGSGSTGEGSEYLISELELNSGYNRLIQKNDIIYFRLKDVLHKILVRAVGAQGTNITISSEPLNVSIPFKGEVKINISSSKYYDLLISNAGIVNSKTNMTIRSISELIPETPLTPPPNEDKGNTTYHAMTNNSSALQIGFGEFNFWKFFFSFIPLFIFVVVFIVYYILGNRAKRLKREGALVRIYDGKEKS